MKKTEELIRDAIWCGLNKPNAEIKNADVVIFGIPFDEGVSFRDGAGDAPRHIRSITYTSAPSTEYFEDMFNVIVKDIGDIKGTDREELFSSVSKKVNELVKSDKFFIMIGGDHSVTIPVLQGINNALDDKFGIIHIDAHFDLCDELDGDSLSHGCTERRAVEMQNVGSSENIFFIGIRSAEPNELEFMNSNKLNLISACEFEKMGVQNVLEEVKSTMSKFNKIYITLDIDALDTMGTGTPQIGGIGNRALLDLLRGLFDLNVIGMDVVEVAPKLDPSYFSVFAARKLITESIGHHGRKHGLLRQHGNMNR